VTRRRALAWGGVALLVALLVVAARLAFPGEPRRPPPRPPAVVAFEEIAVPFVHHARPEVAHGFLGAAALDVGGDGRMEVFLGGGPGQADALLHHEPGDDGAGRLVDGIEGTGLSAEAATFGASAIDFDGDGWTDLLVGRTDGITLYLNDQKGHFNGQRIDARLPKQTDPFALSVVDVDGDGDGDVYVSGFVSRPAFVGLTFHDPAVVRPNRLLRNDGYDEERGVFLFSDATAEAELEGRYNTFQSVWIDLDGDDDPDLVTAPNTGRVEVFRNDGGRFTEMPSPSDYGFWMGVAPGDVDGDGDPDLLFTNVGNAVPPRLLRGDLRDDQVLSTQWLLLRNDGGMTFSDVTAAYGLRDYGFAWGAGFADLDLDGWLDLVVAKNAEKLPHHRVEALRPRSNAFLLLPSGDGDGRAFYDVEALDLQRPDFGMSPLFVDLDDDGALDVVMPNQGQRARAHLGRSPSRRLRVDVPDAVRALGVAVTVVTDAGRSPTQWLLSSTGFMSDHAPQLVFGLGGAERIERVEVSWRGGPQVIIPGVLIEGDRLALSLP